MGKVSSSLFLGSKMRDLKLDFFEEKFPFLGEDKN